MFNLVRSPGIDYNESIPGLLKRLQIWAQYVLVYCIRTMLNIRVRALSMRACTLHSIHSFLSRVFLLQKKRNVHKYFLCKQMCILKILLRILENQHNFANRQGCRSGSVLIRIYLSCGIRIRIR
jgi:hypothetical protein